MTRAHAHSSITRRSRPTIPLPSWATVLAAALTVALGAAVGTVLDSQEPQPHFGIRNASNPEEGVLFSGQPDEAQLGALAEAGYRSILDLRTAEEDRGFDEPATARALGLSYLSLPVSGNTLQDPGIVKRFIQAFRDAERPVLVHCASSNRVGALYYAYLVKEKELPQQEALERARGYGLRSPALVEAIDKLLEP